MTIDGTRPKWETEQDSQLNIGEADPAVMNSSQRKWQTLQQARETRPVSSHSKGVPPLHDRPKSVKRARNDLSPGGKYAQMAKDSS